MKWFLVWVIIVQNPDTNMIELSVTQVAKKNYTECIDHLTTKNAYFEDIKFEDPKFSWNIFCVPPGDDFFNNIM